VSGVYLDNGELGVTPDATLHLMEQLHAECYLIFHHRSIEPHLGRETNLFVGETEYQGWEWSERGPWHKYETWSLVGETNLPWIETVGDWKLSECVSGRRLGATIGHYKPFAASPWGGHPELWYAAMPSNLIACRIPGPAESQLTTWEAYYLPAYNLERGHYEAGTFIPAPAYGPGWTV
jgi:hypothetical protein